MRTGIIPPLLVIKFLRRGFVFVRLDGEVQKTVDYINTNEGL